MVEHLPSMSEVLGSIPSTIKSTYIDKDAHMKLYNYAHMIPNEQASLNARNTPTYHRRKQDSGCHLKVNSLPTQMRDFCEVAAH